MDSAPMMKTKRLSDQVALVTGGGSGIGRSFTEALADAGVRVVIASRRKELLERTASEINSRLEHERVFPYVFDIRDREQCKALVQFVVGQFNSIDILINNCGLAVPETVPEITDEGWDMVIETNLRGTMWLVRAAMPYMVANDFGDIVNISSQAGKKGYADVPSYCASKFGLLGFAESLRDHVHKTGANIRVLNFCPGLVDVDNTGKNDRARHGAIHVSNMVRTLMFALSLSREVVLEDIGIYSRS
jgi:3-oxoacyl-[acyl-carrier protein] reductase